jgi:hypothetical protein
MLKRGGGVMSKYLAGVAVLLAATSVSAGGQRSTTDEKNRPVTMNGCVARARAVQDPVTFSDAETGNKYRLSGKSVRKFAGQRVEIVGGTPIPKRLEVRGGLYPSPNVAAQAGAIDTAKAAIARQPGGPESATGQVDLLPEFRVTRVRVVDGSCE